MKRIFLCMLFLFCGCAVNPAAENNRANGLLREERFDLALARYQAAQVAAPNLAVPYFNAGVAHLRAAEVGRASLALEQALRWTNDPLLSADIQYALGEAYFRQARYVEAVAAYRAVLHIQPENADARYNLELALSLIPTPTPLPSPTRHEGNQDSTATPTSTPTATQDSQSGDDEMTSTPTPPPAGDGTPTLTPEVTPEGEPSAEPNPESETNPNEQPPMNLEDAMQLLDDVQGSQSILPSLTDPSAMDDLPVGERDW